MNNDTPVCSFCFISINLAHPTSADSVSSSIEWKVDQRLGPRQQRGKTALTTAFFGLACSWFISMSCSGLALWTRLSTLNQPLDGGQREFRRNKFTKHVIENYTVNFHWQPQGGTLFPHITYREGGWQGKATVRWYTMDGYVIPGIFWRLCIDVVGSVVSHNIYCIFLLVIVHDLPTEKQSEPCLLRNSTYRWREAGS